MRLNHHVVRACALTAALAGFSTLLRAQHEDPQPPPPVIPPAAAAQAGGGTYNDPVAINLPIEICFVLDTTGSMTRLIQGAKDKVWSIAQEILTDNPKSTLKISFVAYRDRDTPRYKEEYITRVCDLTDDLDALYKQLMTLQAKGGGDKPESVNQALQEAVEKISWTNKPAIKLIFLVGDAPPHMDYPDDVKYPDTILKANAKNIFINAIQCGTDADTTTAWKEISVKGGVVFFQLSQSGNVVALTTPQDKKHIELNAALAATVVPYGDKTQQATVLEKAGSYKDMPLEAAAARVSVNSLSAGRALQGKGDLVQDIQSDKDLLAKVKPEDLPPNMQTMTADQRQAYLDAMLAKRKEINAQITSVTKERDAALKIEEARLASIPDTALPPGAAAPSARGGASGGAGAAGGFGGGGRAGGSFDGAVRAGAAAGRAAAAGRGR
jgi:hypothetical protein